MKSQGPNEVKPKAKLLERVRQVMRLHHYSIHTERTYIDWIKRYVRFHDMHREEDLAGGEQKIEAFLTELAVNGKVAVLEVRLEEAIDAVRAERKVNAPVVLTREEVAKVISLMEGTPQLIVQMLYGSGLRILEAVRLRVKDVDFQMKQVTVRSGKGDKDRFTTLSASIVPLLENHLRRVKGLHEKDYEGEIGRGCWLTAGPLPFDGIVCPRAGSDGSGESRDSL